jgi:ATP-dependent Clp protease ATP-binding subunit ClpB
LHCILDNLSPLSRRNFFCRFLPDKAIDLVDEACAKLKNEITSKPMVLDEIDRRVIQLEMERLSLKSDYEKDEESKTGVPKDESVRLEKIDEELRELKIEQEELNLKWSVEKGGVDKLKEIKEKIGKVQVEIDQAERDFDLNKAAELKYSTLPQLEEQLARFEKLQESEGEGGERMLRDEVVADDIAAVVAVWTGIPAQRLQTTERDRILTMDSKLRERVIGQDEAIQVVTEAVQRSRAGLNDPSKPIASLMFLGPTGVGKTEMSKALAEFMFDDEESLIRIDMSEYMEKHTVSRLLGAPPGYVGYDEGGQLTEAVRRQPYAVLLFDEIEKAHPDVFNVMLQLLDDGRLTDSKGTTVNFRNTICIFTSNIGSSDILDLGGSVEIGDQEIMKSRVNLAMEKHFKPEFLNRIDESIIFNGLSKKDLRKIVKIETKRLEKRLEERQIKLSMSDSTLDYLADVGFDPVYGARPLKRAIQRELETIVARGILSGEFEDGDTVLAEMVDGRIGVRGVKAIDAATPQEDPKALSGAFD